MTALVYKVIYLYNMKISLYTEAFLASRRKQLESCMLVEPGAYNENQLH